MEARLSTLCMQLGGRHLDWQVVSAAQVCQALKTVFSAVENLTLKYSRHYISSVKLIVHIRSFGKVKTLRADYGLVEQISRALQPGEGESPTELFPELQELLYSSKGSSHDAFTLFIDARQKAGHPVTVLRF